MSKSKKYFYLTVLLLLVSLYFNAFNPLLHIHFNTIIKIIIVSVFLNALILIFTIIFADKSIKHLPENKSWIHRASKRLPWFILCVLILHIISALYLFGII
ncbi:hypothetical protein BUZ56_10600 [Staphylococcus hyicus]|uniref:Uncharacterized protein n=1 Tax=Staphylococcus hyicus TaxID=1284 RepID=A0ACD5FNM9_STAHY|nr:hypothetical protein [Staphylococcus hyicus]MCO4330560.1 hypothetical protein [Staphylococcus hyicus]MCO4333796.1 hypothetical protein [Staphylococcus hyicus]MDP4462508.1 hypothetical protein [Staphylococcus hyicus]PTJ72000.1 hypothetical protein BUZ58_05545 [Staphylococcus hyicus]PTJ86705.1 hypothetical protein BUZ56_10600 [Staphylococcus hyicus]